MIRVENVSRAFADFKAVDDVSFTAGQGEVVGLLGHNGAGKTTTMKMLTGFLEPDSGRIIIGDLLMAEQAVACQRLIGYLPENLPLYPEMVVVDYLEYAASMRGLSGDAALFAIRQAIARTELQDKALDTIATLSRGYKQRLGVAQAILHQPRLLILDEPTNGLDPRQTQHMRALIKQLAQQATVILSTHIMQEVDAVCDRVLVLNSGRLALDQPLVELRRSRLLALQTDCQQLPAAITSLCGGAGDMVKQQGGVYFYQLPLAEEADVMEICRQVSAMLIGAGAALYSITPIQRDLESVFREVNQVSEEVSDAA